MIDTRTIQERLRALAKVGWGYDINPRDRTALKQAAAEIDRLTTRLAEAEEASAEFMAEMGRMADTIEADRARIAELEAVLGPFAAVADAFDDREDDDFETWRDCHQPEIKEASKLRHFRRARAALRKEKSDAE